MDESLRQAEPLLRTSSNGDDGGGSGHRRSYGSSSSRDDAPGDIDSADDEVDDTAEDGIQQADAINLVWSRPTLILAYSFILLCSFADGLQWQVMDTLMPYVVSEFNSHSLIPTIGIVASIMSGVLKLPIAKIIDTWGRPQGLASMTVLAAFGLILMASSQNIESYAAAEVIYQVGTSGFSYVLEIIIADTSSLKNRTLAFAFNASPTLLTTFIGPVIARAFYEHSSWRWAFGSSATLLCVLSLPVLSILALNARRAKQLGVIPKLDKHHPWTMRRFRRALVDFDAMGMFLVMAGMTLVLVPFSLTGSQDSSGSLTSHTVLVVFGILLMVGFAFHERKARRPFVKFSLLCSRNVAGASLLSVAIFVAYFAWDGYYTSYLQVVHGLSISQAGYVGHIYGLGSCIWTAVVGYLIRRTDRFKWLALAALPVHLIGGALMMVFRRPDTHIAWIIMCQILITIGGSTLVVCDQMAVMAVASHAELASIMALVSLSRYIGTAMGSSLSGAIWNTTLPEALAELLPQFSPDELALIGSDLKKQLSYPMGSAVRDAIIVAYDRAQVRMCVAGTLISLLEIVAVVMWRDSRVSKSKQVRGTVL
ncbi:MFS general substrate transporter [Xylariaceae sp. FL0662B]|nr:MFS general substrate transporter [Xylariaceae sp. FL0662B]